MRAKYLGLTDEKSVPMRAIRVIVKEILSIAEKETGKDRKELVVLDVGSGFGLYSQELGKYVKKVIGVEPYKEAYEKALELNKKNNVVFFNSLIEDFETREKFDLVVSLTTLEHMLNQTASFKKVFSLLRRGGILYLTAPNKWWPIEPHYALPFLSWLPIPLANIYMKLVGAGKSYRDSSYSLSYFGMKNLFNKYDCTYYFLVPDPNASYLGCGTGSGSYKLIRSMGISLIRRFPILWSISKGFIVVAKKN